MKRKGLLLILLTLMCLFFVTSALPEVSAAEETATATLTFDANKTNRTSFSTTKQVWEQNGIVFTNNKAASTNSVADYGAPVRLYKSSEIVVEHENMTQIVFYCTSGYVLSVSGASTSGTTVTVNFSEPQDSFTVASLSSQVRFEKITVTYVQGEQEDPVISSLKKTFKHYYNSGEFVRETEIFIDKGAIIDDVKNGNIEMEDIFHNPGKAEETYANVILDRTTTFGDNYLYFDNGVGFGTSEEGKLIQFTYVDEDTIPNSEKNAIDEFFITLKDFADLTAESKDVNGDLSSGWTVAGDVYSNSTAIVISTALQFTAPGWVSPDENYVDFDSVTMHINEDGNLEIRVWAAGEEGKLDSAKLEEADLDSTGDHLVFSRAIVVDYRTEEADATAKTVSTLGKEIPYGGTITLDTTFPTNDAKISWTNENGETVTEVSYVEPTSGQESVEITLTATITLGYQVRETQVTYVCNPKPANGPVATFELGANGSASHNDGTEKTSYSETNNGYTFSYTSGSKVYTGARDAKGNSCIKFGTSSAAGTMKFTVPNDVNYVVILVAKYKTNASKISVNGTTHTLTNASSNGAYDTIIIDTTTNKTVELKTVSGGYRCMLNTVYFYTVNPN